MAVPSGSEDSTGCRGRPQRTLPRICRRRRVLGQGTAHAGASAVHGRLADNRPSDRARSPRTQPSPVEGKLRRRGHGRHPGRSSERTRGLATQRPGPHRWLQLVDLNRFDYAPVALSSTAAIGLLRARAYCASLDRPLIDVNSAPVQIQRIHRRSEPWPASRSTSQTSPRRR